jgi:peptidoglycan/LPS O-acetylase OafA/YrhL
MIKFWYLFQLGALAWWALSSSLRSRYFWVYVLLLLGTECRSMAVPTMTGLMTGLGIYLVGCAGRLERWLAFSPLQFYGRISYSLYLVHAVIGTPFTYYLASRWAGPAPSLASAIALMTAAFAVSTAVAYLLYRIVERPSVELSRRLKDVSLSSAVMRVKRVLPAFYSPARG